MSLCGRVVANNNNNNNNNNSSSNRRRRKTIFISNAIILKQFLVQAGVAVLVNIPELDSSLQLMYVTSQAM